MAKFQVHILHVFSLLVLFLTLIMFQNSKRVVGQPLSTDTRWIIDENGNRVKLSCVNWPAHMETLVAEGLDKQPLDSISQKIRSMGFNCVRLTWATFLLSNVSTSVTVYQSFQSLGLENSINGLQAKNPSILNLSLIQAFQTVVESLGKCSLKVILDNHVSRPGWCCSDSDGNGFFGEKYFDPNLWLQGLVHMATLFKGVKNVVGMSLRNGLRGSRQNTADWYRYMQVGAEAIHAANPDLLVILSGLQYDADMSFLENNLPKLSFTRKLVFEVHRYSWFGDFSTEMCGQMMTKFMSSAGFLLEKGFPLFISEFGVDQRLVDEKQVRFLDCFLGILHELDLDWAIWGLQGSYYLRDGVKGKEEYYGMLDLDWKSVRNRSFLRRVSSIQLPSN